MDITAPTTRFGFEIAIICAIPTEYDAVCLTLDEFWDDVGDRYGRADGDDNHYTPGRIGKHNVVVALLSHAGSVNAASAAANVRSSYQGLCLALLVGVCGAVPRAEKGQDEEILLGDVIISKSVVQYDFSGTYPEDFVQRNTIEDDLGKADKNVRSLLITFESERGLEQLEEKTTYLLERIQGLAKKKKRKVRYEYPGAAQDQLFKPSYRHKHRDLLVCPPCDNGPDSVCKAALEATCQDLGCETNLHLVQRERLDEKKDQSAEEAQQPSIHVGAIASGSAAMRSGDVRDKIAEQETVIAFDTEGAGAWRDVPCIIIKGVADYADSHRVDRAWQAFAAAAAAASAKALLLRYMQADRPIATLLIDTSSSSVSENFDDQTTIVGSPTEEGEHPVFVLPAIVEDKDNKPAGAKPPRPSGKKSHRDHHNSSSPFTKKSDKTRPSSAALFQIWPPQPPQAAPKHKSKSRDKTGSASAVKRVPTSRAPPRRQRANLQQYVMMGLDTLNVAWWGVQVMAFATVTVVSTFILGIFGVARARAR
ncbi:hypothetical protein PT974_01446 [Cladobotryum mycophilum]|uniref:Nucleoside phosphorylase domain-containing protein n=1 Tax=Cladobotryum mycophilum TaxID=491253 RepID=A0ABR0T3P8_9HYPO